MSSRRSTRLRLSKSGQGTLSSMNTELLWSLSLYICLSQTSKPQPPRPFRHTGRAGSQSPAPIRRCPVESAAAQPTERSTEASSSTLKATGHRSPRAFSFNTCRVMTPSWRRQCLPLSRLQSLLIRLVLKGGARGSSISWPKSYVATDISTSSDLLDSLV